MLISKDQTLKVSKLDASLLDVIITSNLGSHREYNPRRALKVANAINNYFNKSHFKGRRILEFGPGHYAFSLLARELGAEVTCVEFDKSLAELGRKLGFFVYEDNFDGLPEKDFGCDYDGIWQKGCFNACRFRTDNDMERFVAAMTGILKEDAWGWVSTCNKTSDKNIDDVDKFINDRVKQQQSYMVKYGWELRPFTEEVGSKYAIKYANSPVLFTRNLGQGELL